MERSETREVSFADDGTPSAFERLCLLEGFPVAVYIENGELWLGVFGEDEIFQPLTTDSGDPISPHTALELASAQLLSRLEESK